ncbi:RAM signaling pathway protein [Diplocarpon rosae]|nr:RAM signaling pathway protein [Diplocarpon rosae]
MDRPSGPLGVATQSTGRLMVDTGVPWPAVPAVLGNTVRRMPSSVRNATSSSPLSTQIPISAGQVVALAQDAMKNAIEENQTKAAEASGVSNELKPGVTIDLSHKQIQKFPEEVVDIIKHELERLALSHNMISTFPPRFSECTSLRYLNVRNNVIREFPQSICRLTSLEILDLGRNKLKILPPELAKLTSLKVLSVQKNRIEVLPFCLADMASLQVLKLDGNPVRFPPKEILQPQATTPPNGMFQENETDDLAVTSQIKRFLRQKVISDRSETESGEEESSEGTETPRPVKRVMSGRFPIKVNGSDVPDIRSPALPRPPPIPSRSHYRGLSQQNAALRRPGVLPLTIGNANERLRSNSESLLQATRDRSTDRSRRMGIVSKKLAELDTVDETKLNRYSHFRGLSHGSAMQGSSGTTGNGNSRSPASPADSSGQRPTYVRRLSSLPERKRESLSPDPTVEAAKGIFLLQRNVETLLENGDPRYIRTLLLLVYGSTAEIRNAGVEFMKRKRQLPQVAEADEESETARFQPRDKSVTPTRHRPGTNPRSRSATVVQHSNLRVATSVPPPFMNGVARSVTMMAATPQSGDSFASSTISGGRMGAGDFTEEDRIFEKIFLRLQDASEMTIRALPHVNGHFYTAMEAGSKQSKPDQPKQFWQALINRTYTALQTAESLKARLSLIRLKDPGIRAQCAFWELCNAFIMTYTDLVIKVKEAKSISASLPTDVIILLRPLQKAIKETSQLIQTSPWACLATPQTNGVSNSSYIAHSPASQVPLPMTPQSAALGIAVQATVPSTSQSTAYSAMFSGNVFERADALLSMNASSVSSSRTGTMTSTYGSNDGTVLPSSVASPVNSFGTRFNNNSRTAF